jgi:hypothetical protein
MEAAMHDQVNEAPIQTEALDYAADVCLVACSNLKTKEPSKARDIYEGLTFQLAKAYAERYSQRWLIISAKYGLLDPDQTIESYDLSLQNMTVAERKQWSDNIRRQIVELNLCGDKLVILAPGLYSRNLPDELLHSRFRKVEIPMTGLLGIGQFQKWLKIAIKRPTNQTDLDDKKDDVTSHVETIDFLEQLRPGGPWVLTAIDPDDGKIETITTHDANQVHEFVVKYNNKRNLYYSVNPTRKPMTSKAAKDDIAAIEYLLSDLDPKPDETAEVAKARYLAAIEVMKPEPTAIIDSGNGIQLLLKLVETIKLAKPTMVTDEKGKRKKVFPPIIADVENRTKLLMLTLGGNPGTQNIDRILRLPGTINLPNAKKRGEGRESCAAKLIRFNGATHRLEDFPAPTAASQTDKTDDDKAADRSGSNTFLDEEMLPADLLALIHDGVPDSEDRSKQFHHVVKRLKELGWSPGDIITLLGKYPGGIIRKYGLANYAKEVRRSFDKPDEAPPQDDQQQQQKSSIHATPFAWTDPTKVPQRQWLYKPHYIRQFLSVIISTGGVGKSSKLIAEALAMISNLALLNVMPDELLRVWYWNGEDPFDELQRRFAAAIKYYKLRPEDIGDRLFIDNGRKMPIVLAEQGKHGTKIATPIIEGVTATLIANKIDVLIIDPFVSCHRVIENDNGAIDLVAKSWAGIAEEANCAIMIAHHTRKPLAGGTGNMMSIDDGRGAGALLNAARPKRVLNNMTKDEAQNAGIDERYRRYHFRADNERSNLSPPAESADWFKLVSVDLENNPAFPGIPGMGGDEVGVVTAWEYPTVNMVRITIAAINAIQEKITANGPWRRDQRTRERWVGIPIASVLNIDLVSGQNKKQVTKYIETWLQSGLLKIEARPDPSVRHRDPVEFIIAGRPATALDEEGF